MMRNFTKVFNISKVESWSSWYGSSFSKYKSGKSKVRCTKTKVRCKKT
jgi:hypothetical protein